MTAKRILCTVAMMSLSTAVATAQQQAPQGQQNNPGQSQQPGQPNDRPDPRGADWPRDEKVDRNRAGDRTGADGRMDQRGENAMRGEGNFESQLKEIAKNPEKAGDRYFVLCASKDNTAEVEMARRAMQKTQDPEIQRLAQTLITNHQQANQKLQRAASELDVQLVTELPRLKQQEAEVLFSLPENQFKKAYLSMLKAHHAAGISMYQDHASMSQNQAVKDYASETLTHLRHHNQMVTQAASAAGLPSVAEIDARPMNGDRR